jgi:hypothetical protein
MVKSVHGATRKIEKAVIKLTYPIQKTIKLLNYLQAGLITLCHNLCLI